jgi:hypothetical protein
MSVSEPFIASSADVRIEYESGTSARELTRRYRIGSRRIRKMILDAGGSIRSRSESASVRCTRCFGSWELNARDEAILDGLLLGDACIIKRGGYRAFLDMSASHRDWAAWPQTVLSVRNTSVTEYQAKHGFTAGRPMWHFRTGLYESLRLWRQRWYPDGRKHIPRDVRVSPLALLAWYLGDGSLHYRRRQAGVPIAEAILCTDGFLSDEVMWLAAQLRERTGLKWYASDVGVRCNGERKARICLPASDLVAFFSLVGSCPVPSLGHRWPDAAQMAALDATAGRRRPVRAKAIRMARREKLLGLARDGVPTASISIATGMSAGQVQQILREVRVNRVRGRFDRPVTVAVRAQLMEDVRHAVRAGTSRRHVAALLGLGLTTVKRWSRDIDGPTARSDRVVTGG